MRGMRSSCLREAHRGACSTSTRFKACSARSTTRTCASGHRIRQRGGLPSGRLRGRAACQEEQATAATSRDVSVDPFADLVEYDDSMFGRLLISYFTNKISEEVGVRPTRKGYDAFVEMSQAIMAGRSPAEQKAVVLNVLNSLLPSVIPWLARTFFRPTDLACITCAYFAHIGFVWLVGEMELEEAEVMADSGAVRRRLSTVHIKKCRYLEQSACVGMCVNMCKVPTQEFFSRDMGMPLYMEPNFEDLSCKMKFGEVAPPLDQDPVNTQPCFSRCALAKTTSRECKKLPSPNT